MKLYCVGCAGGFPMEGNGTTAYVVTSTAEDFHLLLDAGSGSAIALESYMPVQELNAIWLSHDHPDHSADLGIFQHLFLLKKPVSQHAPIPIYLNENSKLWPLMIENDTSIPTAYCIGKTFNIGPFEVKTIQTTHPVECAAIRIEEVSTGKTLVFTGDSGWQSSLIEFSKSADVLLADTNFVSEFGENAVHMTSKEVAKLANESQVKQLIVTHIPPQTDGEQIMNEVAEMLDNNIGLSRAEPQMTWEF